MPTGNIAANFTYDANGDMLTRVDNSGAGNVTTSYTWDSIGELTGVAYFDASGNQTSNVMAPNSDGLRRVPLT